MGTFDSSRTELSRLKYYIGLPPDRVDYFAVLGVDRVTATDESVRSRFKALSLQTHPDKTGDHPHAADCFKVVKAAYEALQTADARRAYIIRCPSAGFMPGSSGSRPAPRPGPADSGAAPSSGGASTGTLPSPESLTTVGAPSEARVEVIVSGARLAAYVKAVPRSHCELLVEIQAEAAGLPAVSKDFTVDIANSFTRWKVALDGLLAGKSYTISARFKRVASVSRAIVEASGRCALPNPYLTKATDSDPLPTPLVRVASRASGSVTLEISHASESWRSKPLEVSMSYYRRVAPQERARAPRGGPVHCHGHCIPITVDGLEHGTPYVFEVSFATPLAGRVSPIRLVECSTEPFYSGAPVPGRVEKLKVQAFKLVVKIRWSKVEGENVEYVVSEERLGEVMRTDEPLADVPTTPATFHRFRVAAVNPSGQGEWSEYKEITTKGETPSAAPSELRAAGAWGGSPSDLELTWNPVPPSKNGPVAGYAIYRRPAGAAAGDAEVLATRTEGPSPRCVLRGVPPGRFAFSVSAYNGLGEGPRSEPLSVSVSSPTSSSSSTTSSSASSLEAPRPPESLRVESLTSRTCTLSWRAPSSGPAPTAYAVKFAGQEVTTPKTSVRLNHLDPATAYAARVQALRDGLRSDRSAEVTFRTPATDEGSQPSQPTTPSRRPFSDIGNGAGGRAGAGSAASNPADEKGAREALRKEWASLLESLPAERWAAVLAHVRDRVAPLYR
eukprot:tig00020539_g10438.t1